MTTTDLKEAIRMKKRVINKIRERRNIREYQRVLDNASPSMRQELITMAARQEFMR